MVRNKILELLPSNNCRQQNLGGKGQLISKAIFRGFPYSKKPKIFAYCFALVSKVLVFCVEFRELSHLTHDLPQAEKKINVVTS
jgi:hypothetical protein